MNWSKVFCIEVKKYNDSQLKVVENQLGIVPGLLSKIKSEGTVKIYVEEGVGIIARFKKKELHDKYDIHLYKGLLVSKDYYSMSKKDKDRLLKIQPMDFKTNKSVKFEEEVAKATKEVASVVEILEIDAILDKISKNGINSLTTNEKKFLDDLSKS